MSQAEPMVGVPINDPVYHFPWQVLDAIIAGRSAIDLSGMRISTLQEALLAEGGLQCGYCTPGIVLAAQALLAKQPSPDEASVREGLSNNLCRCTGYVRIVDAVLRAAGARP